MAAVAVAFRWRALGRPDREALWMLGAPLLVLAGNGLAETVPDFEFGEYEVTAETKDPVLFEIKIEYKVFTTEEMGKKLQPHRPLEFKGTLIDLRYESESKPRKLYVRVKADELATLTK